ncbi:MAG: sorbosone dehydrogenase family protein [Ardenticatenaceae bacterium]|nr:sorbosone dehydrogenase family protein [Ardenticatenaceae bacterium]
MNKKKLMAFGCLGLFVVLAGILLVLWLQFRQQVNFAGFQGSGSETNLMLPPGFAANVYAQGLNQPRFIYTGPDGAIYVAERGNGRILRLPDQDQNGIADSTQIFADDLASPHSLVYHEGAWYIGVPSGVIRLVDEDGDGTADSRTTLIDDFPTTGSHSTRTVEFLPDGRLVVSIGSSCNVCEEDDPRRAGIVVYDNAQAEGAAIFAQGLRNAVGLTIHPQTGELWATNNGRDLLGDDLPPETVYIVREGQHYGWPHCHNGHIIDPDFGSEGACASVPTPVAEMQAHSAPLGLVFYTGSLFPAEYQNDLFIAFHGSWNRSVPTGYKVVRLPLDGSTPTGPVQDFATGWLTGDNFEVNGRPVGLTVGADGALYISDDKGGYIYRIYYEETGD